MSRTSTLILLGILVILTPFSGLPTAFRSLLEVIFGACVCGIGLALRAREARAAEQSVETPPPPPTISPI
ncbi:hypothetical protein KGQ72_02085 [Patescibacteria group bacterium]|nr:hypothetical protein [Patescibacteria group bacterium]